MDTALQIFTQGAVLGGVYALIALALAIVYSVTHQLNFAHGDLMAIAMYLALLGSASLGVDPYVAVLAIAPIMFISGFALFRLVFAPMLSAPHLVVIQVTLALSFVVQSALLLTFSSNFHTVQSVLSGKILRLGSVSLSAAPVLAFAVSIVLALLAFYVIRRTDFGRKVLAVAEDSEAASLSGVNVGLVQATVFATALAVLGIAGPLVAPILVLQPTVGLHLTLISFIVFILGGMNNYIGTLVAGLIIGLAEALSSLYMRPAELAPAVPYLIFVLFLLVRPEGVLERSA
ncbi:branched-chain amino acid ABC transporter permease [Ramlibacter sp. RBP-2]|uniref:Branched-chain amino acid ABC transporter permease n=1 Tax=Ramlibacter lithotrophicus TaxID=2606681 RepID=A0A7X6DKL3_9BURK|nr:branched-chain amino acid ABC transporter permease [Ramlibacter lithotrophicus]NKE68887.1 branched-chain amino acid ABC transporter permease [Ramlibacter lithotrophicus]